MTRPRSSRRRPCWSSCGESGRRRTGRRWSAPPGPSGRGPTPPARSSTPRPCSSRARCWTSCPRWPVCPSANNKTLHQNKTPAQNKTRGRRGAGWRSPRGATARASPNAGSRSCPRPMARQPRPCGLSRPSAWLRPGCDRSSLRRIATRARRRCRSASLPTLGAGLQPQRTLPQRPCLLRRLHRPLPGTAHRGPCASWPSPKWTRRRRRRRNRWRRLWLRARRLWWQRRRKPAVSLGSPRPARRRV
mmetsp:Transcript_25680/g.82931  ORF Transcript_25680/g.82931 Transcript_25680/m.82931 type:complete len:246 (+) Transcript_25680:985-1722(+)